MSAPISRIKSHARILHRQVQGGNQEARERLRQLDELRSLDSDRLSAVVQRRHCLALVAKELGFTSWSHASSVLSGNKLSEEAAEDFGTFLYPKGAYAHSNIWSASYDEAVHILEETGGFLLAYKRQFFIVDSHFIETMGLDPEDRDWELMGRNWPRPRDLEARQRLCERLVSKALPRLSSGTTTPAIAAAAGVEG